MPRRRHPNSVLHQVLSEYPGLGKNFNANNTVVVFATGDRAKRGLQERGGIEFWPPEGEPVAHGGDATFPTPHLGKTVLEIYDPKLLNPTALKQAIYGDLMHGMASDPYWNSLRNQFMQNFTPQELKRIKQHETWWDDVNEDLRDTGKDHHIGDPTFDAYLRGWIANEGGGKQGQEESGNTLYSPKQIEILQKMQSYLKTGKAEQ